MAGLADTKGHLTKTYQYTVTGELTHGSATYENEYTYNGESYNPNIHSQYLRARYYSVVTASFLTEDSYLGNVREPLTLNRYNYCVSSYLNYVDPSGNFLLSPVIPSKLPSYGEFIDADITWDGVKEKASEIFRKIGSFMGTVNSFGSGVAGSLVKTALDKPAMWMYPIYSLEENLYNTIQQVLNPWPVDQYNRINLTGYLDGYLSMTESLVMRLAGDVEDTTAYYAGRCTGDVVVILAGMVEAVEGYGAAVAGGGTMIAETASGVGAGLVPGTAVLVLADALVAADGVVTVIQGMYGFANDQQRYQESKAKDDSALKWGNPNSKPTYGHTFTEHGQKRTPTQLTDRARSMQHQVGQWLDNQKAADFIEEIARRGEGVYDVKLPPNVEGRSFLPDGTEIVADMARIIVKPDGSIRTVFPFSSLFD